jgi:hypothetical protein
MIDSDKLPRVDLAKLEPSPATQRDKELQHALDQQALAKQYPTRQTPVERPPPPRKLQIVKR